MKITNRRFRAPSCTGVSLAAGGTTLLILLTCSSLSFAGATHRSWQDMGVLTELVREHVLRSVSDAGGRVVVTVTPPDERLRLPACAAPVTETPEGQRLWGWAQVRVRCPGEGGWSLSVRTRVQVMVPAVVARRALQAGQMIEATDVQQGEADLTGLQRPALRDASQALGKVARLGLAAGQPIGPEHLKLPLVIRRGATLDVVASVGQVSVTTQGTALQDGAVGDLIRVKVPGGRTVQGVVTAEGRVEVQMP
jgi:flagella basal body P-ring formation protein FlgA